MTEVTLFPAGPGCIIVKADGEYVGTIRERRFYGPGNRPYWRYVVENGDGELWTSKEKLAREMARRLHK